MKKILNYIWRGWMLILGTFLTILMGIPVLVFSIRKEHYPYSYKFIRFWAIGMFYGMGFRYELIKLTDQKIDKNTQYVFISNHTSIMDIMLMLTILKHHPIVFVGKAELLKIPIFGRIFERICIPVDRKSARSKAHVYPEAKKKLDKKL